MSDARVSRRATWAGIAGVAGAAIALTFRRVADFDLPWHLATGRYVLEHGIPATDPFSATQPHVGSIDVVGDVVLQLVHSGFGALGLQLFRALLVVGIAVLIYRFSRRAGALAWFCVALALAAMNAWLLVRPATFAFLLTAATIFVIDTHARTPGSRRGRLALAAVIPLALLWANSHGSVVLGLIITGGYALYRIACHLARGRLGGLLPAGDGRDPWFPVAIAAGALAISGLNMAGYGYLTAGQTAGLGPLFSEWAKPTLGFLFLTEPAAGLILVVTAAALLLGRGDGESRWPSAFELGLVAIGVVLTLSAVRLIAFASLLFAYVVARRLVFSANAHRRVGTLGLITVLLLGPVFVASPSSQLGVGFDTRHFPSGAVAYIRKAAPVGPIYNYLPFGGYLAWRLYPDYEVFVDGRTGWVYPEQFVLDAVHSDSDDELFRRLDDMYGFQLAIVRSAPGEGLGGSLHRSERYQMVYFDDVGSVYVKRDGPNAHLIPAGYHWYRHDSLPIAMIAEAMRGNPDLAHDGDLVAKQAPRSPRGAFLSGCGALAARDRAKFDEARRRLVSLVGESHASVALLDSAWNDLAGDI